MRITKDRLSQIILEESVKMDGSAPDQIEEGIFDFLKGEKQETHNQKLNRAFQILAQQDKHLESLVSGLSKQLDKISEKLFGVEEQSGAPLNEGFLDIFQGLFASKQPLGVSEEVWNTVINSAQQLEKNYKVAKQDAQRFAKKAEEQSKEIKELKAKLKEFNPPDPARQPKDDTQVGRTGGTDQFNRIMGSKK